MSRRSLRHVFIEIEGWVGFEMDDDLKCVIFGSIESILDGNDCENS